MNSIRLKVIFVVLLFLMSGFALSLAANIHPYNGAFGVNMSSVAQNNLTGNYTDGNNALAAVYDPFNQLLYVTNSYSNNVTVINSFSGSSVANISVGEQPEGITYVPYNHDIYVENEKSQNISIISSTSNNVIGTIAVPGNPLFSAFDSLSGTLWVSGYNEGGLLWIINVTAGVIQSTITLYPDSNPYGLTFDPANGYMYVADNNLNQVYVISSSGEIVSNIGAGQSPYAIAFDPLNQRIYVTDNDFNSKIQGHSSESNVTIINAVTNKFVANVVPGHNPEGIAFDPVNGYIYIANSGNETTGNISVLNPNTNTIIANLSTRITTQNYPSAVVYDPVLQQVIGINDIATIDRTLNYNSAGGYAGKVLQTQSPSSIAFSPLRELLYVSDAAEDVINVYSLNGTQIAQIDTPGPVDALIYQDNTIFGAVDTNSGQIVIINPIENIITKTVDLTDKYPFPDGLAYDTLNDTLFISFPDSNSVGVLNLSSYSIVESLGVGISPSALTYSNVTNQVYVAQDDDNIHIINASSYVNIYPYDIPSSYPSQAIYDPGTNSIYIANSNNNSMFIINESRVNYVSDESTPFYKVPLGSPQNSIALDPSNGLIYLLQTTSQNVTIFNPFLNKTVGSISSPSISGLGLMTYIPLTQTLISPDQSASYLEEISPAKTYDVTISLGNMIPDSYYSNLQISPMKDSPLAKAENLTLFGKEPLTLQLPEGTYYYMLNTHFSGVNPVEGYFYVDGTSLTLLFYQKYDVNFTENGLSMGVKWSVQVGDQTVSSMSNVSSFQLVPGTYVANITGTAGYKSYPSQLSFNVTSGATNLTIYFQSPQSQKYASILNTTSLSSGISYPGDSYLPINSAYVSLYGAYDPMNGLIFIPVSYGGGNSMLAVYNSSDNLLLAGEYIPNYNGTVSDPVSAYFDPYNSMLYVLDAMHNNLISIYPQNGTVASYVHLPGTLNYLISGIGDTVFVANDTGTVFGVNVNTNTISTYNTGLELDEIAIIPFHNDLLMLNSTGASIIELNVSTGHVAQYDFTGGFQAVQMIQGPPGTLYISGEDSNFLTVFNESEFQTFASLNVSGNLAGKSYDGNLVVGGIYDPLNGYMYFSSSAGQTPISFGNFTVYDPETGKVVTIFPGLNTSPALSMIFDPANQRIYAIGFASDTISVISTINYYEVTLVEHGLPAGTEWKVLLNNGTVYSSTSSSISFLAENNTTYTYTLVSENSSYYGTSGAFTLSGTSAQYQADFSPFTFTVSIKESGLPSGKKWTAIIGGKEYNSTTDEISVQLLNGTYHYSVNGVSGYSLVNGTGAITVRGSGLVVQVKFNSSPLSGLDLEIIAGVVVILGVGGGAAIVIRSRHAKK